MCRYISAKHGGKDICGDGLSVVVFSDKRDIIWLSGCTVCRLGTGDGGMGEKRDKKDGSSRYYSFFVGLFWRCGIALYPVGYRQDTVADTMDCFDMLAVYLRQMTWQDRELQKEFIRIQDDDRVKLLLREHPAFYQILIQDNGKCVHPGDGTGIGITNMRQRVETFGGTIDIRTENGYRIFIHIPKADIPAGR